MKNSLTFDCYSDPGHGWVKVKISLLDKLGLRNVITPYSYMKGDYAYLEEDCDASALYNALKDRGIEMKFRHHFTDRNSKIRSYGNYR